VRTLLKVVLLAPVVWFGMFVVLRVWMSDMQPTTEDIRRDTHARTLADAVCRTDAYRGPSTALVTEMIDKGGDVNQMVPATKYGLPSQPLLARAALCVSSTTAIVALLIKRGARVEDAGLGDVVEDGNADMARLLIDRGASVSAPWQPRDLKRGAHLIQAAVLGKQTWLIERLLGEHADVQVVNGYGRGLLALVLADDLPNRCHADCIARLRLLLAARAHVNPLAADEAPPLVLAAHDGSTEALQLLLDAGADIDASMSSAALYPRSFVSSMASVRATALSAAAYECNVDAVRLLLHTGAPVPHLGVAGGPLESGLDICWEATARNADRPKQAEIRTLLADALLLSPTRK